MAYQKIVIVITDMDDAINISFENKEKSKSISLTLNPLQIKALVKAYETFIKALPYTEEKTATLAGAEVKFRLKQEEEQKDVA